jgi:hypothetical protein
MSNEDSHDLEIEFEGDGVLDIYENALVIPYLQASEIFLHFSMWLKLVPLHDHNNEGITYAFFNRFGVPTKAFIDQAMKFYGKFQKLCEK